MTLLTGILRELAGLFIDDEFLAIAILVVVAIVAVLTLAGAQPLFAGAILICGNLLILAISVLRTARRTERT